MPLSMNTSELFSPTNWLSPAILESANKGLTRFEISFLADDEEAEKEYFDEGFEHLAKEALRRVKGVFNIYQKLCYEVSTKELLLAFEQSAK